MDDTRKTITIIVLLIVSYLIVLSAWNNARTNHTRPSQKPLVSFDPKLCKQKNDDYIYIAIDLVVFKLALDENFHAEFLYPLRNFDSTKLPTPPNPKEYQGCRDNPIQVNAFANSNIGSVIRLQSSATYDHHEETFLYLFAPKVDAQSRCTRDILFNEYLVCNLVSRAPRSEILRTMYKVDEKIYTTPDRKSFYIYCDHIPANNCNIAYSIMPGIGLHYTFNKSKMPIGEFIPMDMARRKFFHELIVSNYKWREH